MKKKIELSACLIARDSAEDIAWCLEGLAGEVDEIIVVDTGSVDDTKKIAKRYTRNVYSFRWRDDFAAAKNFALAKARGAWVFFVDSDERLTDASRGGRLREVVRRGAAAGADLLSLVRHEVDTKGQPVGMPDNLAVRVLKHARGLRFHDPIHEYLAYEDGHATKAADVAADAVALWHRGYAPERKQAKYERNLRLLERAEREGRPKLNLHYYLAGLYYSAERWEDVCRESELSLAAGEHPTVGPLELWRNYEMALEKLGDEARLKELLERARIEAPALPDTYVRLAVFAMMSGDFAEGERLLLETKARHAAFAKERPHDFHTFGAALPQVEHLLEQCRAELAKPAGPAEPEESAEQEPARQAEPEKTADEGKETVEEKHVTAAPMAAPMADLLPLAAHVVVEFGCGRGESGASFLQRQPEARYYGVTPSRADVRAAAQVLTGAVCGTTETFDPALHGLMDVDCIAYGEAAAQAVSLESLRLHAAALAEAGQMVLCLPREGATRTPQELSSMLHEAGLAQATVWIEAGGRRFVMRAVKQPLDGQTMSIQTLLGETVVTARMRVVLPSRCLSATPGIFAQYDEEKVNVGLARQMGTGIVIRQRRGYQSVQEALAMTKRLREQGLLIVYEMDDNPIRWQQRNVRTKHMDYVAAHAVQVSTPELAEVMRQYNPHVFIFENQLYDLPEPRDYAAEAEASGGRVVIFFGALNRTEEWQDILPALNRAAAKYRGKVFFRVLSDQGFFDALETEDKEFLRSANDYDGQYVSYDVYTKALHGSDISLLPLHPTEFNRTKSDLKFIESAGHGAVVLASPTVYARTVVDGCTGFLYRDAEMFEARLEMLIEHPAQRQAVARAAYGYVRDHRMMSQHYLERVRAYRWMAAHQAELDRDLDARLARVQAELRKEG